MAKSKSTTDSSSKKKSKKHKTKKKKESIEKENYKSLEKTPYEKIHFKSDLYEIKENNSIIKRQINLATCMKCITGSYRGQDSSLNENEPNKLCCICQKPKKNRFMISCDTCSEWFHGNCVGIKMKKGISMKKGNLSKGIAYKTVRNYGFRSLHSLLTFFLFSVSHFPNFSCMILNPNNIFQLEF